MSTALSHLDIRFNASNMIGDMDSPEGNGWQTIRARILSQEKERKEEASKRKNVEGWRKLIGDNRPNNNTINDEPV